jgi:HSP20 family protein
MVPIRYSTEPFALLRTEMDRLFDDFLMTPNSRRRYYPSLLSRRASYPAFNVWESEECFYVEAECPGLAIEEMDLSITGNQLSVAGERKEESLEGVSFHRRERGTGKFSRIVSLPSDVDANKVEARFKDGVLTITLPKAETAKTKKIQVAS